MSFLLTKVILLLVLSCNRARDSGKEHCVETSTDKQDDTQVGEKNCTNQQLWYDTAIIFNYDVQHFNMIYGNDLLFCNFPRRIVCITFITNAIAVFLCLQQPFFKYLHHLLPIILSQNLSS